MPTPTRVPTATQFVLPSGLVPVKAVRMLPMTVYAAISMFEGM